MVDPQWLQLLIECVATDFVLVLLPFLVFPFPMSSVMGLDPGVFGRFDLAALVQPHLQFLFVCLFATLDMSCLPARWSFGWT